MRRSDGFLHMNNSSRTVASSASHRRLFTAATPPVANGQPIGRGERIVLVPAGVFFELIRGRIDQFDRLVFDSCLVVRQILLLRQRPGRSGHGPREDELGWWENPGHRDRSEWRSMAGANSSL